MDLLLGGNLLDASLNMGLYGASYGLILTGDGKGEFKTISSQKSGILINGQVRDIKKIKTPNGSDIFAITQNDDEIVFYK